MVSVKSYKITSYLQSTRGPRRQQKAAVRFIFGSNYFHAKVKSFSSPKKDKNKQIMSVMEMQILVLQL